MNTVHITHTTDKDLRKIGAGFKAGNQYTGDLAIESRTLTEFENSIFEFIKTNPGTSDEIADEFQIEADTRPALDAIYYLVFNGYATRNPISRRITVRADVE